MATRSAGDGTRQRLRRLDQASSVDAQSPGIVSRASARDTRRPRAASCRATLPSSFWRVPPETCDALSSNVSAEPTRLAITASVLAPTCPGSHTLGDASWPESAGHSLGTAERGGDAAAHGVAGIHRAHVAVGTLVVAGALRRHEGLYQGQRVESAESALIIEARAPDVDGTCAQRACTASGVSDHP